MTVSTHLMLIPFHHNSNKIPNSKTGGKWQYHTFISVVPPAMCVHKRILHPGKVLPLFQDYLTAVYSVGIEHTFKFRLTTAHPVRLYSFNTDCNKHKCCCQNDKEPGDVAKI